VEALVLFKLTGIKKENIIEKLICFTFKFYKHIFGGSRKKDNPCEICGGKRGTRSGLSHKSFVFALPVPFHHGSIFTHISSGGWVMGLLPVTVQQRHSLTQLQQ
jgi:hypothetical protein